MGICNFFRRWRKRRQARKASVTLPVRQVYKKTPSDVPATPSHPRYLLPADYHPELRSGMSEFERSSAPPKPPKPAPVKLTHRAERVEAKRQAKKAEND